MLLREPCKQRTACISTTQYSCVIIIQVNFANSYSPFPHLSLKVYVVVVGPMKYEHRICCLVGIGPVLSSVKHQTKALTIHLTGRWALLIFKAEGKIKPTTFLGDRHVPIWFENVPPGLQYLEKRGRTEEGAENKTLLRQWLSMYYNGLTILPLLSFLRKEAHKFIM